MTSQKQSKFNPASLPYIMALAQALQIAHAGYILTGWFVAVIGGVLGAGVSFSVAYAGSQIASLTGQKRERWANPAMFLMMGLSPLLIAAAAYISFEVIPFDWLRWVTAVSWALAPDGAIFLASLVTGRGMVAKDDKPQSEPQANQSGRKRKKSKPLKVPCEWCGKMIADSQNAKNAHAAYCAVLQEASRK